MGLEERDYMRDVPEYRRLVGLETAPAAGGGGAGKKPPLTTWADPPLGPPWWQSMSSPRRVAQPRTRPWAWFLLGVIVTLAAVGYIVERGLPDATSRDPAERVVIPPALPSELPPGTVALSGGIPVVGPPLRIPMGGREAVAPGTAIRVEGQTPLQRGGSVVVKVRWNDGPWQVVNRTRAASDGSYRVSYQLGQRGRAQVRIVFPGGSFAYKWYRIG
jgi:hypothetical protein